MLSQARSVPQGYAQRVAWVLYVVSIGGLLVGAYGLHQRANAQPVQPTWRQAVVTVDDVAMIEAARAWGAPFRVEFAAVGADVTVVRELAQGRFGGQAAKTVDGDRITGCSVTLHPGRDSAVVMAHEFGHCLGLHHDNGHSDSLMFWVQGGDSGAAGVTHHDRTAQGALYSASR